MLSCYDLTLKRGSKTILSKINEVFVPGKIYGILGPNGSGKSSFLRALANIWPLTEGCIKWNGQDFASLKRLERAKLCSLVPQTSHQLFDFSVEQFVGMGRFPHGTRTNQLSYFVDKALFETETSHLKYRSFLSLSVGEKQRVAIARALTTESSILLLDEPTSSLDLKHESLLWKHLHNLAGQGKVIITTLHNFNQAEQHLDEALLLHEGQIEARGAFRDIITPPLLQKVFSL